MRSLTVYGLCLSLLAALAAATPARAQRGAASDLSRLEPYQTSKPRPLAEALLPDGTLRTRRDLRASFDASGWRLVSRPGEAPRFAPARRTTEPGWDDVFSSPATDDFIRAVAVRGEEVFVGGGFVAIGKAAAYGVARWDGQAWHSLGDGEANGVLGTVYSIAVTDTDVYVGGTFGAAGGAPANNIARWDGQAWHPLGEGEANGVGGTFGELVYAIAPAGDAVYVGGVFTEAGGVPAAGFAVWDRASGAWAEAFGGVRQTDPEDPAYVFTIAVDGTSLYFGGKFEQVGGVAARNVAKADLSSGAVSPLGAGMDNWVNEIVASDGVVYAGGFFTRAGKAKANHVARWNGKKWQALQTGLRFDGGSVGVRVLGLALLGGDLYVSGYFDQAGNVRTESVARWDGKRWRGVGGGLRAGIRVPFAGDVLASGAGGGGVYVAGHFNTAGSTKAYQLARWTPAEGEWSTVADVGPHEGVYDGLVNTVAVDGDDVYLGGAEMIVGGTVAYGVARWDGQVWHTLGEGEANGVNGYVNAIEVVPDGIVVGGIFSRAGDVTTLNVAKWDGAAWSGLASGVGGTVDSQVFDVEYFKGEIYASGIIPFVDPLGSADPVNNIARWDGERWLPVGEAPNDGMPGGLVLALEATEDTLYAGGFFFQAGETPVSNVARWDGLGWTGFDGGGVDGGVFAIAADGDRIYFGGDFLTAGPDNANKVAVWSKSQGWLPLGQGLEADEQFGAYASAMLVLGGKLYVAGTFQRAGGLEASNLAVWDGSSWSAVGGGLDKGALGIAAQGDRLWLAGGFALAGGRPSLRVARYSLSE